VTALDRFPKISIVTAVFNRQRTIADTIESVLSQSYANIEYIVVDGMSNDGTNEVIDRYAEQIDTYVREPDDGIYDALNKGIARASGDVIGFVHADDLLAHDRVISAIADVFERKPETEAVYGDLLYVDENNTDRVVRYWRSGRYRRNRFFFGWMPPHPTCYIRRRCYEQYGDYDNSMSISADYDLLVRMFVKHEIRVEAIQDVLVKMRVGGVSNVSLRARRRANREDALAWSNSGLRKPFALRLIKPLRKIGQYWARPPKKA
jgi:glycosyltransferase involved in cell wall biosynthesis